MQNKETQATKRVSFIFQHTRGSYVIGTVAVEESFQLFFK